MATMLFKATASGEEEKTKITGLLRAALELGNMGGSIEARGSYDTNESLIKTKIECTFKGDYALSSDISTLEGALEEAKLFPQRLSTAKNILTAQLLPLSCIDSKNLRICRQLSEEASQNASKAIDGHQTAQLQLEDLRSKAKKCPIMKTFTSLLDQLSNFETEYSLQAVKFRNQLASLLPKTKGGDAEEAEIMSLCSLAKHQANVADLFTKLKSEEIEFTLSFVSSLVDDGFVVQEPTSLLTITLNKSRKLKFLFNLCSVDRSPMMHTLQQMLEKPLKEGTSLRPAKYSNKWWEQGDFTKSRAECVELKGFNDLAGVDAEYWLGFLDNDNSDSDETLLVHNGDWMRWTAPQQPQFKHEVDLNNCVTLRLLNPQENKNVRYLILLKRYSDTCKEFVDITENRNPLPLDGNQFNTPRLSQNQQYKFVAQSVIADEGASEQTEVKVRTGWLPSVASRLKKKVDQGEGKGIGHMKKSWLILEKSEPTHWESATMRSPNSPSKLLKCLEKVDVIPEFESTGQSFDESNAMVVILCGETGSGKTTHINAVMNWLMGVKVQDPYRILLIDDSGAIVTQSVTSTITIYRIRHLEGMPLGKDLMLVDSPGFLDTKGLEGDAFITAAFMKLFEHLTHVTCVGLVVNSTHQRLTAQAKYVIEVMLQLYHKCVRDNILPICTFANHADPLCIAGLVQDKVPFKKYVKVENSMFSCKPITNTDSTEQQLYWDVQSN
eukprot:GHVN01034299.1.p1 GENE.GHVN01034299.1~~GHVN01034299.1.p1  ORF type:complete len:724 (-),score=69.19 GHVN01034299.1:1234-3405(-)